MRRRDFLGLASTAVLASGCRTQADTAAPATSDGTRATPRFAHGVASGDPLADRVILWTRVEVGESSPVRWVVAEDEALARVVARGEATTSAERDFTVKVDATGLLPGRTYHYRFEIEGASSPTGRTRTLPVGAVDRLRVAFTSCANFPFGHFNVYAAIARRDDLDAVLHLGDYLYEYADGVYGNASTLGRSVDPAGECVTLADYRLRHASYKRDVDLQEVHRRHPFITVWDDHEIANDAWLEGAQNHGEGQGEWAARRTAAVRAYREWMPIRDPEPSSHSIYRAFRFGDLLELTMLDTRIVGRHRQVGVDDLAQLQRTDRALLGAEQERWLLDRLAQSQRDGVAWRVLGQQVMIGQLRDKSGVIRNPDMWDGYPAARDRILAHIADQRIRDVVVLTGDIHSSWATEVHRDPFANPPSGALAVELVTPAVSSPPPFAGVPPAELIANHPHIRWVDLQHRGYVELELSREEARATWHHCADVTHRNAEVRPAKTFAIPRGRAQLVEVEG